MREFEVGEEVGVTLYDGTPVRATVTWVGGILMGVKFGGGETSTVGKRFWERVDVVTKLAEIAESRVGRSDRLPTDSP